MERQKTSINCLRKCQMMLEGEINKKKSFNWILKEERFKFSENRKEPLEFFIEF